MSRFGKEQSFGELALHVTPPAFGLESDAVAAEDRRIEDQLIEDHVARLAESDDTTTRLLSINGAADLGAAMDPFDGWLDELLEPVPAIQMDEPSSES